MKFITEWCPKDIGISPTPHTDVVCRKKYCLQRLYEKNYETECLDNYETIEISNFGDVIWTINYQWIRGQTHDGVLLNIIKRY